MFFRPLFFYLIDKSSFSELLGEYISIHFGICLILHSYVIQGGLLLYIMIVYIDVIDFVGGTFGI